MPISLKPVSRRKFLEIGGAATCAYLAGTPFAAIAKPVEKDYWALFSDTHISANRGEVHNGVNMAGHLDSVVKEVLDDNKMLPSAVLVNGDCAYQSGEEADYATFLEGLNPLRTASVPIHLSLGNHDHRGHFAKVLHQENEIGRTVPDKFISRIKTSHANWLLLDSLEQTSSPNGTIGQRQLEWLTTMLDKSRHTPAIIVVHHNPFFGEGKSSGLLDTSAMMEALRPRSNAKAIIFGHTHKWGTTRDETSGIHLVNLPPVAYPFEPSQPSGWVKAILHKNGLDLELRCIDIGHPSHAQKVSLNWR